jgi:Homing endonuclease associated repeat
MTLVDPAIHNSNTVEFKGPCLAVPAADRRFPEDEVLDAVRRFTADYGIAPTAGAWTASGMIPSEKTIRRRFGSFRDAIRRAGL